MARHSMEWEAGVGLVSIGLCLDLDLGFAAPSYAWTRPPSDCMYIPNGECLLLIFGLSDRETVMRVDAISS